VASERQPLLEVGREIGRYRVLGALGAGGMGEVYLAEDRELGRRVAIKLLGGWLTQDEERAKRFKQEARTLASLNHPNIVTIYSVEHESDTDFLTMELVEGPSLDERIAAGPMPLAEAIGIARQMAEALGTAHAKGIIHRDLKPANVKITTDGKVKVLDFGLAKSALQAGAGDVSQQATLTGGLTLAGTVLGTPSYMSPEQARGERVDARADVWAFGCVLYEMLAGQRTFPGRTATDVLAAVIKDEPGWDALPPSTPPVVRDLIHRCLEKDAGQRLGDMAGVSGALEEFASGATSSGAMPATPTPVALPAGRVAGRRRQTRVAVAALIVATVALAAVGLWKLQSGGSAGPSIRSIAVLPLTNVSGNPDDQYFADGMTDVLIANLGSIEALKVISRTSVMAYRGASKPPREIARELKVDAIVEGSALRSGDRVRITAHLIDAGAGTIIWSETYERDMRDVMTLQGDVARAIARKIQVTLAPDVEQRLTARPVRPDVYEDYLKGRYFLYQATPEGLQKAEEFFNRALEKDPESALAHAGLADVNVIRAISGFVPSREALEKAKMHAVRAVQLDDELSDAHASLGWISFQNWDWVTSEKEFRRALQLNPNSGVARVNYAQFLGIRGRNEEALREGRRSRELDPLSLPFQTAYAAVLIGAGRYDDAIALCQETLRMNAGFFWAHEHLWRAYEQKGMFEEALAEARASFSAQRDTEMVSALERGQRQAGYAGAMREAAGTLAARARTKYVMGFRVATLYAQAGEKNTAIDWLERTYEQHGAMLEYIRMSPEFKELRPDPRYKDLLRRLNLADDQVARSSPPT
jgi:TolB-like protein/tetratricopeptide (TPR) repeat protein/predicted Ser/Thr protein kinase